MNEQSQLDDYDDDSLKILMVFGVFLITVLTILLVILKFSENNDGVYEVYEVTGYTEIEILDTLRDLEVKVEAETVTKDDIAVVDSIFDVHPFTSYSREFELLRDFEELVEEPSDTYLKKIVTEEMNRAKTYVLNYKL